MALLDVQNISVRVEEKQVLSNVNLQIQSGETHVLLGPNGAGKSTLGNAIMGNPVYTLTGGKIIFDGQDITEEKTDKRAKAGLFLSFQNPLEVPGISLETFIRSAIQQRTGERVKLFQFQKELKANMELLNMEAAFARPDVNVAFTRRARQKSEILQLLMMKPKLAILDETDSGLDVDAVRTVSKGIEEYQKRHGGALLIITHSTRILESLNVDYTHILVKGTVVKTGDGSLVQKINENGFDEYIK